MKKVLNHFEILKFMIKNIIEKYFFCHSKMICFSPKTSFLEHRSIRAEAFKM